MMINDHDLSARAIMMPQGKNSSQAKICDLLWAGSMEVYFGVEASILSSVGSWRVLPRRLGLLVSESAWVQILSI